MPDIPPGIVYLSRNFPRLAAPPALPWLLSSVIESYTGIHVSRWLVAIASVLALPGSIILTHSYSVYKNGVDAAAAGAILPPLVPNKWPAGLDILFSIARRFKDNYPADAIRNCSERFGPTFRLDIFFEERIFTTEPEYIKAILATQFDSFEKGRVTNFPMYSLLGTGVFNSDGDMWK
jgi:hypothetical protein